MNYVSSSKRRVGGGSGTKFGKVGRAGGAGGVGSGESGLLWCECFGALPRVCELSWRGVQEGAQEVWKVGSALVDFLRQSWRRRERLECVEGAG